MGVEEEGELIWQERGNLWGLRGSRRDLGEKLTSEECWEIKSCLVNSWYLTNVLCGL